MPSGQAYLPCGTHGPFGLLTIHSSISLILEDVPLATTGKDLALDAGLVVRAGLSAMVLVTLVLWTFLGPQQKPAGCAVLRTQQQPCVLEFVQHGMRSQLVGKCAMD